MITFYMFIAPPPPKKKEYYLIIVRKAHNAVDPEVDGRE